jgi:hypothetical protein
MPSWIAPTRSAISTAACTFCSGGDRADRREQRDRDRVGRAVDQLARGVEQRADRGHHDRGVEAVLGGQARDLRVRHRLRHRDRGHGEAGEPSARALAAL